MHPQKKQKQKQNQTSVSLSQYIGSLILPM
jgi:hypothetical protein